MILSPLKSDSKQAECAVLGATLLNSFPAVRGCRNDTHGPQPRAPLHLPRHSPNSKVGLFTELKRKRCIRCSICRGCQKRTVAHSGMGEQFQFDLNSSQKSRESKRCEGGLRCQQLQFICLQCDHHTRMQTQHTCTVILHCPHCYAARKPVPPSEWIRRLRDHQAYHNQALEEMLQQRLRRKKPASWRA